jgi:hypothetical protein
MQVTRFSLPATVAAPLHSAPNKSLVVRSAMQAFARSKKCTPGYVFTMPALNARQQMKAEKFSMKADPEWVRGMKKIAAKVVTDRPRGERFSRFVAAALAWQQARA